MQMQVFRLTCLAAVVAISGACGGATADTEAVPERAEATVRIENRSFLDMRIYAVRATQRMRIGTVTGNTTQDLSIPSLLVGIGAQLQIVADPIGGRRARVSETFSVNPGDHITMTISPP